MSKHSLKKQSKIKNFFLNLILIVCILAIAISIYEITKWNIDNKKTAHIVEKIADAVTIQEKNNEKTYNIDFEKLKQTNNDIVAWLKVYGTNIEYPIVKGTNNSYYLNYSLDKTYNIAGWPFIDYRNKLDGKDKNIIIYAHNRKDHSMFGTLKNVLTQAWYDNIENRKITVLTENEECIYDVFSVYQIKDEAYYITTNFSSDENFEKFVKRLKNRSIYDFNIEVTKDDSILTLSTCANNNKYRVVLHAKRSK